jgi:cytochrome c peroxidase
MSQIELDRQLFAFSVAPDLPATVEVLDGGPLQWSSQTDGPFQAEGELAAGVSQEFTVATLVQSPAGKTTFELTYPSPEPPEAAELPVDAEPPKPDGPDLPEKPDRPEAPKP